MYKWVPTSLWLVATVSMHPRLKARAVLFSADAEALRLPCSLPRRLLLLCWNSACCFYVHHCTVVDAYDSMSEPIKVGQGVKDKLAATTV